MVLDMSVSLNENAFLNKIKTVHEGYYWSLLLSSIYKLGYLKKGTLCTVISISTSDIVSFFVIIEIHAITQDIWLFITTYTGALKGKLTESYLFSGGKY